MSKRRESQEIWMSNHTLPETPSHPLYTQLNRLFQEHGCDSNVKEKCAPYYANRLGRPSIPPGVYLCKVMIGYSEGLESEGHYLARRRFLGSVLLSGLRTKRVHSGPLENDAYSKTSSRCVRRLGPEGVVRPRPAGGQDGGAGCHYGGTQRGYAQHLAPRPRARLPRVSESAGPARRDSGADRVRGRTVRPQAWEQGIQPGLGASQWSSCPHNIDERRTPAHGLQGRLYGRSGHAGVGVSACVQSG